MNVYLSGLIGVGKSTVGQAMAELLGWPFDDLDLAIERMAGKNFHQVVEEEGWLGFRMREYAICKQFSHMDNTIIGLGGGTVRYEWNRDVLKGSGINILLTADLTILADRLTDNDRPRVNPGVSMQEDLAWMWENHKDIYIGFADFIYPTDQGKTILEEAKELSSILKKDFAILQDLKIG
jgi:shikimate kinase